MKAYPQKAPQEPSKRDISRGLSLLKKVRAFAKKYDIGCPEAFYQCDRVAEALPEFAEEMVEIAGRDHESLCGGSMMAKDWEVIINDTGGPFSGWPSVCSKTEDRTILHQKGFIQSYWPVGGDGPTLREAKAIAQAVADFMNRRGVISDKLDSPRSELIGSKVLDCDGGRAFVLRMILSGRTSTWVTNLLFGNTHRTNFMKVINATDTFIRDHAGVGYERAFNDRARLALRNWSEK